MDLKIINKKELQVVVLDSVIEEVLPNHPFSFISNNTNYKKLMANYLAMSQAFPYLQAGSQKDIFFHSMENNNDVPENVELTSVVGNFLCWDETGGLYLTLARGLKGLPQLLETRRFHANLLRRDCELLFSEPLQPEYSTVTKKYLYDLYAGLSSTCAMTRVAYMVSFENHANCMITALWQSITNHFKIEKKRLVYFLTHVGGDDPAEAYHVEMTRKLISKIIPEDETESFSMKFKDAYSLHSNWCKALVDMSVN